ncbi:MAG: glycosyltransferase family 2 protein [Methanobrevibacter sp.]
MYKISVIVPVYNVEKYLNRCIDSVINQTIGFENIELLLLDDCSTDNTKNIMEEYEMHYDNIKCFYLEKNQGTGLVRNIGLDNATGKYIMFLDSDDYYKSNFCEVMFDAIDETEFNIVGSKFNLGLFNMPNDFTNIIVNPLNDKNILLDIWMWNKIYRKSFIDNYNIKCSNKMFEDVYFILECWFNNNKDIKFLPKYCGYYHIIRESSNEKSLSYDFDESNLIKIIDGLKFNTDYIKNSDYDFVLSDVVSNSLIYIFILAIQNKFDPKIIVNHVLNIKNYVGINLNFDEKWAEIFYNACINKSYFLIKLLYKIFALYFNSSFLKRLHRNNL